MLLRQVVHLGVLGQQKCGRWGPWWVLYFFRDFNEETVAKSLRREFQLMQEPVSELNRAF